MKPASLLKRVASKLPGQWQQELKRLKFARDIRRRQFRSGEQEYDLLGQWVRPDDWVIDIGANVGHYTARLSTLVGPAGRVIALEPVPATFELLAATVARLPNRNVTLLNVAASDAAVVTGMSVPRFDTGLDNYYMAHLTDEASEFSVFSLPVDVLGLPNRVSFVKIDAEGHDLQVVRGMRELIARDLPRVMVESSHGEIATILGELGYSSRHLEASSNVIFEQSADVLQPGKEGTG